MWLDAGTQLVWNAVHHHQVWDQDTFPQVATRAGNWVLQKPQPGTEGLGSQSSF